MHLAIDIGNSVLKFALFDGEKMTVKDKGIEALSAVVSHHKENISQAIMASVADSVAAIDHLTFR